VSQKNIKELFKLSLNKNKTQEKLLILLFNTPKK